MRMLGGCGPERLGRNAGREGAYIGYDRQKDAHGQWWSQRGADGEAEAESPCHGLRRVRRDFVVSYIQNNKQRDATRKACDADGFARREGERHGSSIHVPHVEMQGMMRSARATERVEEERKRERQGTQGVDTEKPESSELRTTCTQRCRDIRRLENLRLRQQDKEETGRWCQHSNNTRAEPEMQLQKIDIVHETSSVLARIPHRDGNMTRLSIQMQLSPRRMDKENL
ncbi:hypothetical protein C8F04DRAFT_1150322 [Mycena alexandri]|uniref:Uncharacterized protein n=1 Tax=Mycena alexandri TaxID=1745969 RepID=A0AAD6WLK0_9AGAR|nr:hypothetical protein C8F04DRAFT_1150322 [Mycena alexandri]